jgi:hypothetical protein
LLESQWSGRWPKERLPPLLALLPTIESEGEVFEVGVVAFVLHGLNELLFLLFQVLHLALALAEDEPSGVQPLFVGFLLGGALLGGQFAAHLWSGKELGLHGRSVFPLYTHVKRTCFFPCNGDIRGLEGSMNVTKDEEQRIKEKAVQDLLAKQKRELSERMSKLGRIRSPKKRRAVIANAKIARAAKTKKYLLPKRKP